MRLSVARLCLNCEEVHDSQTCPMCASETFAYIKNWVPDLQPRPRPSPPAPKPLIAPTFAQKVVFGGGVLGLAAFWAARWSRRAQRRVEDLGLHAGELR